MANPLPKYRIQITAWSYGHTVDLQRRFPHLDCVYLENGACRFSGEIEDLADLPSYVVVEHGEVFKDGRFYA